MHGLGLFPDPMPVWGLDSGNEAVNNLVTLAGLLSVEDLSRKLSACLNTFPLHCTISHTIRQSCVYSARTYSGLTIVVWASGKLAIPSHPESGLRLATWQELGYARLPRDWVRVVLQASPILFHSTDHSVLAHRGRVCIIN